MTGGHWKVLRVSNDLYASLFFISVVAYLQLVFDDGHSKTYDKWITELL